MAKRVERQHTCGYAPLPGPFEGVAVTTEQMYLVVMVGIIAVISAIAIPSLFFKKCPQCGRRNRLDANTCAACGAALPEEPHV